WPILTCGSTVALCAPALIRRFAPPSPTQARGRRGNRLTAYLSAYGRTPGPIDVPLRVSPVKSVTLTDGSWPSPTGANIRAPHPHVSPSPTRLRGGRCPKGGWGPVR